MTTDFMGLGRFELFRGFDDRALGELSRSVRRRVFSDGQIIVEQGGRSGGAFIVLDGEVRVERSLPTGQTVDLSVLHAGRVFGALSLMDGGPRAARCVARGRAVCAELPRADCQDRVAGRTASDLRFQLTVLRALFNDLRVANHRLAELAALPAEDISLVNLD